MTDKYGVEAQIIPDKNEEEIWVPAPGWEDRYEISNFGNLRYIRNERLRKLGYDKYGYLYVSLKKNTDTKHQQVKSVYIHRLVCEAFNGPPTPERNICDHIDHCIENNYYRNLRWVSSSENVRNTLNPHKAKGISRTKEPIVLLDNDGNFVERFASAMDAHKKLDLNVEQIMQNIRKKRKPFKCGQFILALEFDK